MLATMLQTHTHFEQSSFGQEHVSLCLESEDTIKYKEKQGFRFFSSCIFDHVPQLEQDIRLDHKLNIV